MRGEIDDQTFRLIVEALRKAILHGKPIRLIQSGKGEGLFPKELETRVKEHCFSDVPLFSEEKHTKDSKVTAVVPGPGAVDYLAQNLDASEISHILSDGLEEVSKRIRDMAKQWAEVVSQNDATQQHVSRLRERALEIQEGRRKELEAKIADQPLETATLSDFDFIRRVGVHIVHAWAQANDPEVKSQYEAVLRNSGFIPFGQAGERQTFSARLHECTQSLFPGDPAVVERPGWMVPHGQTQIVLTKARVRPAT
jgi:hypothetical protein